MASATQSNVLLDGHEHVRQHGRAARSGEARLGVSITPVRDAIAQLAVEGLIDIAPNRTRRVTHVTQKNALELIVVMELLACGGVEWGIDQLTDAHISMLRTQLQQFRDALQRGDVGAASASGAHFSTVLISACENRELQEPHRPRRGADPPHPRAGCGQRPVASLAGWLPGAAGMPRGR